MKGRYLFTVSLLLILTACGRKSSPAQYGVGVYHIVRPGQSLYRIAKTYGVEAQELSRVNGIKDLNRVRAGQRLFIPGARRVLEVPVYRPEETAELERRLPTEQGAPASLDFTWPVKGEIVARFGIQDGFRNNGVAIAAPEGTPIQAAEAGRVIYSGAELRDYGNMIIIDHHGSFATVYAHNRVNLVRQGDQVTKGQAIAEVGMSGIAESPYLHFEIRKRGKAQDPLAFLK
jgi:lipoprotein NlpD